MKQMTGEIESPKSSYEIKNDYAFATGRARALEAKIMEPNLLEPAQVLKEYGLAGKDIDERLEELFEKDLMEFIDSAPEAVAPFRLMADLTNMKAFVRMKLAKEKIPTSCLGSFAIPEDVDELKMKLTDAGHPELADKLKGILSMELNGIDLELERYFVGKIENSLFRECLELKKNYLNSEETPLQFYAKLGRFVKEKLAIKNMDPDIPTAYLLLRQRELELARAKAIKALLGG
ncbi:MAG: hypothetical protein V1909_05925 [Candidatus Micrarchaeota archaeon]